VPEADQLELAGRQVFAPGDPLTDSHEFVVVRGQLITGRRQDGS